MRDIFLRHHAIEKVEDAFGFGAERGQVFTPVHAGGRGVLVEQLGVRSQSQYMQEFLATLYTADMLYGVGELRDYGAIPIVVPA